MDQRKRRILKIIALLTLIAVVIGVSVYLILRKGNATGGLGRYSLQSPSNFFAMMHENMRMGSGMTGRDENGSLYVDGVVTENGIDKKVEADKYPITYEAGHPQSSKIGNNGWDSFCRKYQPLFSSPFKSSQALVLEDGKTHVLNQSIDVAGIVVRHNTTLYISKSLVIRTGFILVESGGLLQAGHTSARYKSSLSFVLTTTPLGYAHQPTVASQYSYKWYNPGVLKDKDDNFTDFTGETHCISNHFSPRCFAVGFCGNLHLCGDVSSDVKYTGTWSVQNGSDRKTEDRMMTIGMPDLAPSYPNTWTHVEQGSGMAGTNTITLDPETRGHTETWTPGSEIVVTYYSSVYATASQPQNLGTPPIWLNYPPGTPNYTANEKAVQALNQADKAGVEIAVIKSIKDNIITLKGPLRFNRSPKGYSSRYTISDSTGDSRSIDTRAHVGLLTRRITIRGEIMDGPGTGGMNNMPTSPALLKSHPEYADTLSMGKLVADYGASKTAAEFNRKAVSGKAYKERDANNVSWEDAKASPEDMEKYILRYRYATCPVKYTNTLSEPAVTPEELYGYPRGTWQLGSEGWSGSNAIGAANCMFRMGSMVTIDGVQARNMGAPGNTGNLGAYVFHFHLAGYTKSFDSYGGKRFSCIRNCSMVQCPSRLIVLHGTSEVMCINNISLLSFNSAYFLESGGERFNRFEHQLAIGVMLCRANKYDNPSPIMPLASFDAFQSSVYWLKNSCNEVVRCVTCCSPRPMVGIWFIPQQVSTMSSMADICPGDEERLLPSSITNQIMSGPEYGPNGGTWNPKKAWAPSSYFYKGLTDKDNCSMYSHSNEVNPSFRMLDNVFYNIAGGFTSYVAMSPNVPCARAGTFDEPGATRLDGARHTDESWEDSIAIGGKGTGVFVPIWGENAMMDSLCTTVYIHPEFNGSSSKGAFEPFSPQQQTEFNGITELGVFVPCSQSQPCPGNTHSETSGCRNVPFVIGAQLSWNLCEMASNTLGAGWSKCPVNWVINSCSLQLGGSHDLTDVSSSEGKITSSGYRLSYGANDKIFTAARTVYHNYITDGALQPSDTPMLFSGSNSFFSVDAKIVDGEYPMAKNSVYDWYLFNDFPSSALEGMIQKYRQPDWKRVRLYDITKEQQKNPYDNTVTKWKPVSTLCVPYACEINDSSARLARVEEKSIDDDTRQALKVNPHWKIIFNAYSGGLGTFSTSANMLLGDQLCAGMAMMKPANKVVPFI